MFGLFMKGMVGYLWLPLGICGIGAAYGILKLALKGLQIAALAAFGIYDRVARKWGR